MLNPKPFTLHLENLKQERLKEKREKRAKQIADMEANEERRQQTSDEIKRKQV